MNYKAKLLSPGFLPEQRSNSPSRRHGLGQSIPQQHAFSHPSIPAPRSTARVSATGNAGRYLTVVQQLSWGAKLTAIPGPPSSPSDQHRLQAVAQVRVSHGLH